MEQALTKPKKARTPKGNLGSENKDMPKISFSIKYTALNKCITYKAKSNDKVVSIIDTTLTKKFEIKF